MSTDYTVVDGWESLSDAEAIKAAVDRHGKDGTTSVAWYTLEAWFDRGPEYRFWMDLFLKLTKQTHVGWA
ncbi:hypothetical protein G6M87_17150 [Rhizobium rhizogenes]|uniref:hypothetical protein n=1 Tax=Rhizobium rhizogenes TaxID=359 RepID=UPI001572AC99|nr:hypothetical protein [Rhizobium rhizogenes]NTI23599.1 hypothetical protein [Rhizobium rhizogenes]QTG07112.1 hypothetical protein G6M87_17150 [Rhizobium rhizogenes]